MYQLSDTITRKFTDVIPLGDEWEIMTDTGWEPLDDIKQTVEYDVWQLELENGMTLECADDHIVFDELGEEIFVKDLTQGTKILTQDGPVAVKEIQTTLLSENMYDVAVCSENHRFYSNGILSHNTTVAAGYLLWYAMFHADSTILVAAHKGSGAYEIMKMIRYAYELCPDHIRAGATAYNKGSLDFDNGSRIVSSTTTETTGRGMALTLIYLDEFAFVAPNVAKEFWTSLSPTLSTGGKCIITSTPNSDEDTFATIWRGANDTLDEHGNALPDGVGKNGFKAYIATWDKRPDRPEDFEKTQREQLGTEKFEREHECITGDAKVKIKFPDGTIKEMSIIELEGLLSL